MAEVPNNSTELNNATAAPAPNARPSTPGEFAASWNARDEEGRAELLAALIESTEASSKCFMQSHISRLELLEQRFSGKALAGAFTEWHRRWTEQPERYLSEQETLALDDAGYGEQTSAYLLALLEGRL